MPTEVPRCSECGAALKAVPSWLAGAKASFTCGACPKRPSRAAASPRIDKPVESKASDDGDDLDDLPEDIEEIDEESDLEVGVDDDTKEADI